MNITLPRAVIEQALEALEEAENVLTWDGFQRAADALRTALGHQYMTNAAGELEPVTIVQTGVGIGKPEQEESIKRPVESDYTSHVAYTRALEGYCDALEQPEQERVPVTDNTYNYAKTLAEAIFKQHFASDEHYASGRIVWGVNDTVIGILTQIDNMVADMVRKPAQPKQEPVWWMLKTGHGTEFKEKLTDELRALTWKGKPMWKPLYTTPPQRKPLTEEEIKTYRHMIDWTAEWSYINFAKAIEAAHGIKD